MQLNNYSDIIVKCSELLASRLIETQVIKIMTPCHFAVSVLGVLVLCVVTHCHTVVIY